MRAIQFIGTQRSGSNLLRLILNQHSLISAPHPPHLLKTFVPLIPYYKAEKDWKKALVEDMCRWVEANPVPWTRVELDRNDILRKATDVFEIFEQIYIQKAAADEARIWCCKSTFNIQYIDQLERQIKPFYIHLYRDGRDVAASFKRVIVGHKHAYHLAKQWREEQEKSVRFLDTLAKDRKIHLSYESLIEHPELVIKAVCDKLQIDYSDDMLLYYTSEESQHTAESGKMWESVTKPVMRDNKGKFLRELNLEEIKIFEQVAGSVLTDLGYTLTQKDPEVLMNIDQFDLLDEQQMEAGRKNASLNDIKSRLEQDQLLSEIKMRLKIKAEEAS